MTDRESEIIRGITAAITKQLRVEIWKASATLWIIAMVTVFYCYRSDFAVLRAEMRSMHSGPTHVQQQQVNFPPAEGLLERETKRVLDEGTSHGDLRGINATDHGFNRSADR